MWLHIDPASGPPIYRQIADQVRQAVDRHAADVPADLWTDLVGRGLLAPEAHPDAFAS